MRDNMKKWMRDKMKKANTTPQNSSKIQKVKVKRQVDTHNIHIQWNLCNLTPELSDILYNPIKIDGPKVFLLTKIKPGYSDILYNPTHFPSPLVCRIWQFPLCMTLWLRTETSVKVAIYDVYYQLRYDENGVCFVLDEHDEVDLYSVSHK